MSGEGKGKEVSECRRSSVRAYEHRERHSYDRKNSPGEKAPYIKAYNSDVRLEASADTRFGCYRTCCYSHSYLAASSEKRSCPRAKDREFPSGHQLRKPDGRQGLRLSAKSHPQPFDNQPGAERWPLRGDVGAFTRPPHADGKRRS